MLSKSKTDHLPYPYYFIPTLIATLLGIADSIYLAYAHYKNYTDTEYASFCAISKSVNCDTVSQSSWSIFLDLPVAYWGLFGYVIFFTMLLPARNNSKQIQPLWSMLFLLSIIFSVCAVTLGYISAEKIKSYCIFCIFSYLISFTLLFYCWIVRRRFEHPSLITGSINAFRFFKGSTFLKTTITLVVMVLFLVRLLIPVYWNFEFPHVDDMLPTGVTEHGHPWIGAKEPIITIEEFTDYQCFQCAKMHRQLRLLIAENPGKIRLVHRNYPMDHEANPQLVPEPFHVGSARMALLSIAAIKQDKFWHINDQLYSIITNKKSAIDIRALTSDINANADILVKNMYSKDTLKQLEKDIRSGLKNKITGTPSYIINGKVYEGTIPAEILAEILD